MDFLHRSTPNLQSLDILASHSLLSSQAQLDVSEQAEENSGQTPPPPQPPSESAADEQQQQHTVAVTASTRSLPVNIGRLGSGVVARDSQSITSMTDSVLLEPDEVDFDQAQQTASQSPRSMKSSADESERPDSKCSSGRRSGPIETTV